ncbi:2-phospho-L-lactate transferase [Ancylobacter oerskovii]|uniref:2-phospho-L-lactate transferase n=1 Tax=Ancylobacter oerskovii TaxID=459519 RepID=A0ABW4Z188_9HYPH|nr:2-phospho-L-lactate transferase [Ancylobacter oerskovii]MBS7542568.1 2-phospho-L-lactate transferase [Ancylobacter oerskovii]
MMAILDENSREQVLALCGGIGGAKLALGLYRTLAPGRLTVAVNTGDDFSHLGLHVSPDIDTVAYTLAGLNDTERGWGLAGETWHFMEALGRLGGETWFQLGDHDLATHVLRTRRLAAGETLSQVTSAMAGRLGLHARLLPMSDDPVRTLVDTEEGRLAFQNYFVEHHCRPRVTGITFAGAEAAKVQEDVLALLGDGALAAIVICPSNPYLSVDPLLAIPGLREALKASPAPVVAVSPIVGGRAVKGPTAKIMEELGLPVSSRAIAEHYGDLLDGFILDDADAADATGLGVPAVATRTLMETLDDRERLARSVLNFASGLRRHP